MRKLYDSFSRLLLLIQEDGMESWNDDENSFYFFGCMKEGIDRTFAVYDRFDSFRCSRGIVKDREYHKLDREKILSILENAEKQGRVRWRTENESNDAEWLSKALGIPMNIVESMRDDWGCFNLPKMEETINNHPELNILLVKRQAILRAERNWKEKHGKE